MHMFSSASGSVGRARQLVAALAVVLVTSLGVTACGSDDATTSVPLNADDEAALIVASDELVAVCAEGDHARLADLSGPGIQGRTRDQDNVFNGAVESVVVVDRIVAVDGDTATVAVTLDVTIGGESSEVERIWAYERVDDAWVLSSVPDCLFS